MRTQEYQRYLLKEIVQFLIYLQRFISEMYIQYPLVAFNIVYIIHADTQYLASDRQGNAILFSFF